MKIKSETKMIPLIDGYYFSCDEYQYVLYYCGTRNKIDVKTKKQTGEMIEFTDTIGFYTDLKTLLKACVKHSNMAQIRSGNITSLEDCISRLEDMYSKIESLTKNF